MTDEILLPITANRENHPSTKLLRLEHSIPDIKSRFQQTQAFLKTNRFLNFRSLNNMELQFLDQGLEIVYRASMKIRCPAQQAFKLLKSDRFTRDFNAYLRNSTTTFENADYAEYVHQLRASPASEMMTRRFFKTFFIEDQAFSLVEMYSGDIDSLNQFSPIISLISLKPQSAKEQNFTTFEIVTIARNTEEHAHYITDMISFYSVLELEAPIIAQSLFGSQNQISRKDTKTFTENGLKSSKADTSSSAQNTQSNSTSEAVSGSFNDKRDALTAEQLQTFNTWHTKLLASDPSLSEFPPNDFVRFLVGYRWVFPDYELNFLSFVDYYRAFIKGKTLDDFPAFGKRKILNFLGIAHSGEAVMVLKASRLSSSDDPDEFCQYMVTKMLECLRLTPPTVQRFVVCIDTKDAGRENLSIDKVKQLNSTLSYRFPEVMSKIILINLGYLANMSIKAIKLFLHEVTRGKIVSIGTNTEEIKRALIEFLPLEKLPSDFGGTGPSI